MTFYLLRDWEKVVEAIDDALPRDHADTIRKLVHESNAAIAGYVRAARRWSAWRWARSMPSA